MFEAFLSRMLWIYNVYIVTSDLRGLTCGLWTHSVDKKTLCHGPTLCEPEVLILLLLCIHIVNTADFCWPCWWLWLKNPDVLFQIHNYYILTWIIDVAVMVNLTNTGYQNENHEIKTKPSKVQSLTFIICPRLQWICISD